jgi:flagellar basal-body rod modification protein FlgD
MTTLSDIATINSVTGSPAATPHKTASTLGVQDFLTLMTTQLKNQDPLKPLDSTEFVAQLAQFGTVSGIQGMQSSLASLSSALISSQVLSGTALVGHEVLTAGNSAQYSGTGAIYGKVDVPAGSNSATVTVTDSTGQVVRHISVDPTAGSQAFGWDGKSDSGEQLAPGNYKFNGVAGSTGAGQSMTMSLYGRVNSVSLDASGTQLTLNTQELGPVALSSVREAT